jgi:hypothetical protein
MIEVNGLKDLPEMPEPPKAPDGNPELQAKFDQAKLEAMASVAANAKSGGGL